MAGSGMGSKAPIAHNTMPDGSDNPVGRARNRRVEVQMATREGVTLRPGAVEISGDEVRVGGTGVSVDSGGVTAGGIRIDIGEALCRATAGSHSLSTIACMEGAFEEVGVDMDSDACDDLEDAMATGIGNAGGSLCRACQQEQGFGDAACAIVLRCLSK